MICERRFYAILFTPKHPSTLPKSQWLSYTRLFSIVQPYAPARVWRQGRGNFKQLVTEWCQHHPAYAGLAKGFRQHDMTTCTCTCTCTCT